MRILILLFMLIFSVSNVWAGADSSVDSSKQQRLDKEKTQSIKRSRESRESQGSRKSKTTSSGIDKQVQDAIRAVEQAMQQKGLEVSIDPAQIFLNEISLSESSGDIELFRHCRVLTNPKLPVRFGLSAMVGNVIYVVKSDYLQRAATNNAYISSVMSSQDEDKLIDYIHCLANYGALLGQAYLNLASDVSFVKTNDNVGYADFIALAKSAWQRAIERGIEDKNISNTLKRVLNSDLKNKCQFFEKIDNIRCLDLIISIASKPQLFVSNSAWFGDKYAGIASAYKVSKNWSYADAVEKLKSTSRFSKVANEVSRYAEELESQGKTKEAVMVKKKLFELAKSGKQNVSLADLTPK